MTAKKYCLVGLALCGLLSVADLSLTRVLIKATDGAIYEGNPMAALWLQRFGWYGLAFYKAATLVPFVASVALLARYRPRTGAWVVTLACLALTLVTSYSCGLLAQLHREAAAIEAMVVPSAEPVAMPAPGPWNPALLVPAEVKP
jgi:hypothetical protein